MATQITVQPVIPERLLQGIEGAMLMRLLDHEKDGDGNVYFFSREDIQTTIMLDTPADARELLALAQAGTTDSARSLSEVLTKAVAHFETDPSGFFEFDVNMNLTLEGQTFQVDHIDLLADLSKQHPDVLPEIEIMGAFTEHKMRPGNFGGLACLITPTAISEVDTYSWATKEWPRLRSAPDSSKPRQPDTASEDYAILDVDALPAGRDALEWIILEALEISRERIQGLSAEDAASEAASLRSAVSLLKNLGGDTAKHDVELQEILLVVPQKPGM